MVVTMLQTREKQRRVDGRVGGGRYKGGAVGTRC
jgi:hypothetical protein